MKKAAIENRIIFLFFALCMGALAGAAVWAFFFIMGLGIQLIWTDLPSLLKLPFYPLIVCTLGGLIIGLWKSRFGDYPQDLSQVMAIVKKEGGYPYHNLHILAVSALIPLLFGASLGPEAGLTGFIAGICTFIGDKFKYAAREMRELTQVGMAATLGVIFNAPFFGIANQMEEGENPDVPEQGQNSGKKQDYKVSKRSKMVVYLASVAGGFLTLQLLTHFLGGGMGIPRFSAASEVGALELICLIPLALTGVLWGYFYAGTGKLVRFLAAPLGKHPVLLSVLGGICLGALGMFLPLTLFSGEHEMGQVMESWENLGFWTLLLTGVLKLLILNICLGTGWKGGNFFPIIFSGVSIGYAMATLLPVEPVFAVAAVTSSLVASVLRKPFAAVLLLLLCFPPGGIISMCIAAVIGSVLPVPGFLKAGAAEEE